MDWRVSYLRSLAEQGRLVRFTLLAREDQRTTIELVRTEVPKAARPLEFSVFTDEARALSWLGAEGHVDDERERLKAEVREAFAATPPPDPSAIRGSSESEEPFLLEDEFRGVPDWRQLEVSFIDRAPDGFGTALSFFSREAFRYYLPAYLLADLDEELRQADPVFHLWHGLDDENRDKPVNERRYGRWTWFEAIAERFGLFTDAEARAIVAFLRYKAARDAFVRPKVEQALASFWLARAGEPRI
jgi:hypothetical protein